MSIGLLIESMFIYKAVNIIVIAVKTNVTSESSYYQAIVEAIPSPPAYGVTNMAATQVSG